MSRKEIVLLVSRALAVTQAAYALVDVTTFPPTCFLRITTPQTRDISVRFTALNLPRCLPASLDFLSSPGFSGGAGPGWRDFCCPRPRKLHLPDLNN